MLSKSRIHLCIIFLNERHSEIENTFISNFNLDKEYFSEILEIPEGVLLTFILIKFPFALFRNLHEKPFNPGSQMQIALYESYQSVLSSIYMTASAHVYLCL